MGDARRSSSSVQSKMFGYTNVVKEESEAEIKAEKAEGEDSDQESDNSNASLGRCSYQEAILLNPGPIC